jgi:ElaB/YqjD/DUF883 family membrane-anchored ribosome-binding protein
MSQTVVERMADHIAESSQQASDAADAVLGTMGDRSKVMLRAVKQSGDAAEELLHDAAQRIRRNPVLSVTAMLAIGVVAGTLISGMMKRR